MIKYSLRCANSHGFEAWFANSVAYDGQSSARQILCPECGVDRVEKALMAPNIVSSQAKGAVAVPPDLPEAQREALKLMRQIRDHVRQNSDYVGPRFAEEALKIHNDEVEARNIYGEASGPEIESLRDEGVEFYPLPTLPEDQN